MARGPVRVLVVEVNWLGDVLFSTPALRAVRRKHPGAYIAVLVVPRCKEILAGNNQVDEIMILDESGRHRGLLGKIRLVMEIRRRRFDIAYFFHRSFTRALCVALAGVAVRIGYATKKRAFLLTEKVPPPESGGHRADSYYHLVMKTRIPSDERRCDFPVSAHDRQAVETFLSGYRSQSQRRLVAMHVGGNWDLKQWPVDNFRTLIDELHARYGCDVILTGTAKERQRAEDIAAGLRDRQRVFVASGLTDLKQLGALFARCDLVVSADSGPLHVAAAVGARYVALFGPTSPRMTGPLGFSESILLSAQKYRASCQVPCYDLTCSENVCMRSITPAAVMAAIEERRWMTA